MVLGFWGAVGISLGCVIPTLILDNIITRDLLIHYATFGKVHGGLVIPFVLLGQLRASVYPKTPMLSGV